MAQKAPPAQAAQLQLRPRAAQELPLLQGQGHRGGLQERQPASALHLGEGQDPQPPHHGRVPPPPAAGRGRGEAGPRGRAPALRRELGRCEIILLKDVEKVGLRGEVVNVARGYARNFLLPRELAEVATPGRVAEVQADRGGSRPARGAQRRAGERHRGDARQDRAAVRRQGRPHRIAVRLGHDDGHRRRDLADAQDPRRPSQDRCRLDQADRPLHACRSTCSRASSPSSS